MAINCKACVLFLPFLTLLSSTHGAAIHSEVGQVLKKVQDVLVNPDTFATALGMRVKRDTGDWDKEFDLEDLGISFKIKYRNPNYPAMGGHALLKFPGHRFVKAANFDDVELKLNFDFNHQLKIKIEYKFIQKSSFFADRPHQGAVTVDADVRGSTIKLKMSLERNATKEFEVDADVRVGLFPFKLNGTVMFEDNTMWDLHIDFSFGHGFNMNVQFFNNGVEYSLAANLFADSLGMFQHAWKSDIQIVYPEHKHSLQLEHSLNYQNKSMLSISGDLNGPFRFEVSASADLKVGKLWIFNGDKTYALVDLTGDYKPYKAKYVANYTFMDGWPQFKTQGNAIIHYDGLSDRKIIAIDYTEMNGKKGNVNLEIEPTNSGLKYLMDINHDGKIILRQEGEQNNAKTGDLVETTGVTKTEADESSPFYKLYCYHMYPMSCATSLTTTRKYTIYINRSANVTYEEETFYGNEKLSSMKVDTTSIPYSFTWEVIKAPYFYPFEGKIELTGDPTQFLANGFFNPSFKFEKNGKTIVDIKVDLGRDIKVDFELDEDFYQLNKWFGSLIHPIPHFKHGEVTFRANHQLTLNIKLDSLNYIYHMNFYTSKGLQLEFGYDIPVAPEWCPVEGKFVASFSPIIGIAIGGSSPSHSVAVFGANTTYIYKHQGITYLEGEHNFLIDQVKSGKRGERLILSKYSKIAFDEKSFIFAKLCKKAQSRNCSKAYEYEAKFYIDSRNNTMDFHLEHKLDGETSHLFRIDAMNKPYQLIWSESESSTGIVKKMFGLETLEVTADYEAGKELIITSNLAEMNLTMRKEPNLFIELKRYGETYLKFIHQMDQDQLSIDARAHLYIPTGSIFCGRKNSIYFRECYNKWEGELKVFVNLKNKNVYLNKHSINAFVKKDMEVIFKVEQNTNVSPYVLKIEAPQLMDILFDDPHKQSLDLTVDHQEGKLLHIQTNHPEITSFKIIDRSKLEINGKDLIDYNLSDNHLSVTYQLPSGETININLICIGWSQWTNPKNQALLNIDTPEAKYNLDVKYDVTDVKNGQMKVNIHGETLKFGKYRFLRKADWKVDNSKVVIAWDGKVEFEKGPLIMFSPIDTKAHVDYDVTNMILSANIVEDIAGQKWIFQVTDNKVNLSTQ